MFPAAYSSHFGVPADINNDGITDLLVLNVAVQSSISVLLRNGDGTFRPPVNVPWRGVRSRPGQHSKMFRSG
jgi:hypothetical protein